MVKSGGSVTTKHKEVIREESQRAGSTFMKARRNPIKGFITALRPAEDNDYYYQVRVRVDTQNNANAQVSSVEDVWLPLAEDPAVISLLYGDKDLILNSRCRIEYTEASPRTGQVFIEYDPRRKNIPRKSATEIERKAYLYATAGGGKLF